MDRGINSPAYRYRCGCLLLVYADSAVIDMKGRSFSRPAVFYIIAAVNALTAFIEIYAGLEFNDYSLLYDWILHILTALACFICAVLSRVGSGNKEHEIFDLLAGFPQIKEIYGIHCCIVDGEIYIDICIAYNTYTVKGSGSSTTQSIESALKRRFGADTKISINVKNNSLI